MLFSDFISFDGSASRISVLDDDLPVGNHPRTLEAWVRLSTLSPYVQPIVNYGGDQDKASFGLSINPWGQPYFFGWNNDLNGNIVVSDGEWHRITVVYDGAKIKIYVDGLLDIAADQGNTGRVYPYAQLNTAATDQLVMGQVEAFTAQEGQFKGDIKSIRVWDYAIEEDAIKDATFSSGHDLGLVYSFLNGEMEAIFDTEMALPPKILSNISHVRHEAPPLIEGLAEAFSTIFFFNGSDAIGSVKSGADGSFIFTVPNLTDGTHIISAISQNDSGQISSRSNEIIFTIDQDTESDFKNYLSMNGSVSRIYLRDDDLPTGNSPRTLETWVRISSVGSNVKPIINYGNLESNKAFGLSVNPLGQLYFYGRNDLNGNSVVSDGEWHKLTLVYDTKAIRLYIDGILDIEADQGNTGQIFSYSDLDTALTDQSVIGQIAAFTANEGQFHGDIKSIKIWDYALEPDVITPYSFSSGDERGLVYSFLVGDIEPINNKNKTGIYSKASQFYSIYLDPDNIIVVDQNTNSFDSYSQITLFSFSDLTLDMYLFQKTASLSAASVKSLVELYIASFNRAPDAMGLNYWGGRVYDGLALDQIAKSFFVQPETVAAYPASQSVEVFVDRVYNNVLSRSPDGSGMAYWKEAIESGRISKDVFLLAIINGAKAETGSAADKQTLINKTAVGMDYAFQEGLSNVTWAKDVMASVNTTPSSVQAAYQKTDGYAVLAEAPNTAEVAIKLLGAWDNTL